MMKKRILSLLLAFLMVSGMIPATAFAATTGEVGGESFTTVCSDCGNAVCTCGAEEPLCPYCDATLEADGTVTHAFGCNAVYAYDGTADVGKYVRLIPDVAAYGLFVSNDPMQESSGMFYYYEDFGADTVMRITDWCWEPQTTGLWYKVELYSGSFPPSEEGAAWPNPAWILHTYTDTTYAWDPVLEFVTVAPPSVEDPAGSGVTVSGAQLPADAALSVAMPSVSGSGNTAIYDISLKDGSGNVWQPTPGETVTVSIPAPAGAESVNIFHFLEDPEIIQYALNAGIAQKFDVSGAIGDANYPIIENAVKAYQEAFNTSDMYVVMEAFGDVAVSNGIAAVHANGFSAFVISNNTYSPTTPNFTILLWEGRSPTYYVRPGELIVGTGWTINQGFHVTSDPSNYVSFINNDDDQWITDKSTYFTVAQNAEDGYEFRIRLGGTGLYREVIFIVKDDIDYDNVRICVLPETTSDYPIELSLHSSYSDLGVYYLQSDNTLATTNHVYTTTLSSLINRTAILNSGSLYHNEPYTVYGIVDTVGTQTVSYLTDQFNTTLAPAILDAFCDAKGIAEAQRENYKLVVYVVKYEAIGDNIGWYINCKVEKKDSYVLSYDYNLPDGLNAQDHIKGGTKPNDKAVYADENGAYTTAVDFTDFHYEYTTENQTYTGTFLGWSDDPNAQTPTYTAAAGTQTITLTANTTLYAVWKTSKGYDAADVTLLNLVQGSDGNYVATEDSFVFTASSNMTQAYTVYDASGIKQSEGSFASSKDVTLKGGWYLIVEDVPNGSYSFTMKSYTEQTYAPESTVKEFSYNEETNTSGRYYVFFTSALKQYTVTWKTDADTVLKTEELLFGQTVTAPADPEKTGHTFDGWDGYTAGMTMPAQDQVFTALWKPITYTVRFLHADGTVLQTLTVNHGDTPVYTGAQPQKADTATHKYSFTGWSPTLAPATANADYTAVFSEEELTCMVVYTAQTGGKVRLGGSGDDAWVQQVNEQLRVSTGVGHGAEARADDGWRFAGWYLGEEKISDNAVLDTPKDENTGLYYSAQLTAAFEPITVDLTVTTACDDPEQSFIFEISGTPTVSSFGTVRLEVVLTGSDSIVIRDLPVGDYTVTEKNEWSWRHTETAATGVFRLDAAMTQGFAFGAAEQTLWLSGCSVNKRRKGGS